MLLTAAAWFYNGYAMDLTYQGIHYYQSCSDADIRGRNI
jgi:hypothetical protein